MRTELCASAVKAFLLLSLVINHGEASGRWSRQLTDETLGDWIPVDPQTAPIKRQAQARVLNQPAPFQSAFFPAENEYRSQESARQLYLQSVPSQFINQQSAPVQLALTDPQYNPLAQAFIPQANYNNVQYTFSQAPVSGQVIQHPAQINNQFYSQSKKQAQEPILAPKSPKQEAPRYVDGYKLESSPDSLQGKKKAAIAGLKNKQETKAPQKVTERASIVNGGPTTQSPTTIEKEEVQLLYVPLETLQNDKFDAKQYFKNSPRQESLRDSIGSPGQINNQLYSPSTPNYQIRQQSQLQNIQQELLQQAFNAQALQGKFKQNPFERQPPFKSSATATYPFTQSLYPTPVITTPKSKKLKAHQPPLAIYMVHKSQEKAKLSDVLTVLRDAKDISVLDSIGANSPKVFVGPSNIRVPNYYAKFELPYLSSIDGNRIQRNVDKLPFFVAPLSYKAPDGFAKIPFPAPHVGSVIVNPFMNEVQEFRPTAIANSQPNSFSYSTYQQNPSTESFRTTIGSQPSTFNFFPSATPNPVLTHQSTLSNYQSSYSPFEQTFSTFRQPTSSRKPEASVQSTSPRQPLSTYFSTTPAKPTVSYYSFSGPEYSTLPATTKPPYRGHYITNAAADERPSPIQLVSSPKDITSEKPQTTPIPPPSFQSHNAYSINQAFQPTAQESPDVKNVKANEINRYKPEKEKTVYSTQYDNQFSSISDYSPVPYYGPTSSSRPNELDDSPKYSESTKIRNENQEVNYSPIPYPSGDDNLDNLQYHTESYDKEVITTTTTTTTTTVAPTTKSAITRRPIHLRGRPRYTTQKPDSEAARTTTTRRTPIRERKPSTYRTRFESSKTVNTEAPVTETTNFESGKKRKFEPDTVKTNRYSSQRNKPAEEEGVVTTESSLPKTSAANRNQRLRSRGKTHFKTSDNYEGSDYVAKKNKKTGEGDSIAYQRDVLHQNYPVTLTEKLTTAEIRTSTANPIDQQVDLTNGKIRIYETTGSTQRPYGSDDIKPSETPLEYYDNQPVFQGEPQKYLTQLDSHYEGSSERTGSTIMPELYFNSRGSSTENSRSSTRASFDLSNVELDVKDVTESYEASTEAAKEQVVETLKQEVPQVEEQTEKIIDPTTVETPVARFRNKLRSRPKFLLASTATKESENGISIDSRKKVEDTTEASPAFTRRSSVQPITYRPPFDRHRTTMRIEEIEAELKSSRQQLKSDIHSTTFKYPVYVPGASSTTIVADTENNEATTKRNHFARRRPTRPASVTASPVSRTRATTESAVTSENTTKRVKSRGRVRTRPTTTEKPEEVKDAETTEKAPAQRYTARGRQATQKYFKKPSTEKAIQESAEDQASYDSINRPEYVEYKINNDKSDYGDYNPENGKAESHWSPKLTFNSFRPIFNPNLIADDIKQEGVEYGTKLPSAESEESEIITARNPYDDMLISVTPANNINGEQPSTFYDNFFPSTTYRIESNKDVLEEEKSSGVASAFESVLEEVMRNLEQQDEDEYNGNYDRPVVKQEVGEIGEIPPETETDNANDDFEKEMKLVSDIKKVGDFSALDHRRNENYDRQSDGLENKFTTTTERQARRRGVWRRIKVRPVNKNNFDPIETQLYGNSNDLLKNKEVIKAEAYKFEIKKEVKEQEKPQVTTEEATETTIVPTDIPEVELVTEFVKNPGDMDLGIDAPVPIASENEEMSNTEAMPLIDDIIENKTEYLMEKEYNVEEDIEKEITTEAVITIDEEENHKNEDTNFTQRSVVTEISKDLPQKSNETEIVVNDDVKSSESKVTSPKPEEIKQIDIVAEKETSPKVESVDSTISPPTLWDPKNIISTSMSTEVSHETEICYRGRCIKTKKLDQKK